MIVPKIKEEDIKLPSIERLLTTDMPNELDYPAEAVEAYRRGSSMTVLSFYSNQKFPSPNAGAIELNLDNAVFPYDMSDNGSITPMMTINPEMLQGYSSEEKFALNRQFQSTSQFEMASNSVIDPSLLHSQPRHSFDSSMFNNSDAFKSSFDNTQYQAGMYDDLVRERQNSMTSGSSDSFGGMSVDPSTFGSWNQVSVIQEEVEFDEDDDQPLACKWDGCGAVLTRDDFFEHVNSHMGSGQSFYACEWEDCIRRGKPFKKRLKLQNHLRTHTKERPFVCHTPGCGRSFSRQDGLNTHQKTHSNIKPFVCDFPGCGKAYFHPRSLRKHCKSHEKRNGHMSISPVDDHPIVFYDQSPFASLNLHHDQTFQLA